MPENDLTSFLRNWPLEPGRINVRRITAADGREKIQVRIELGVLQMEIDGRPDGGKPNNHESLLAYQLDRLERYVNESGSPAGFLLSGDECRALREEAVQYYHRYVALFALDDFERVARDTLRNLQLLELCRDFAAEETDRAMLEQFRPHLLMMRTRAEGERAIRDQQPRRALEAIDRGLAELRDFYHEAGQTDAYERSNEAMLLRGMRDALIPKLPASQRVELEERLRAAIDAENYELAAILRDELRLLKD